MMPIRTLITLLFFMPAVPVFAQTLTWEGAVQKARQHNPVLSKAEKSVRLAKLGLGRSYTNFLPSLSANASSSQSGSDTGAGSKEYSYGLSGSISLFSGFGDLSELKGKQAELLSAEASYKRSVSDVFYSLKRSFIQVLWAQEMTSLTGEILKRRTKNFELVQLKYEAGTEDKGSLLRAEADKLSAEYEYSRAQRSLKSAGYELLKNIGDGSFKGVAVKGGLTVSGVPESVPIENLLEQTPEYMIADYNVQKAKYDVTSARSQFYPSLSFGASTGKSGDTLPLENGRWSAGLTLSYPLFPGGRNIYDNRIAQVNRAVAEQSFTEIKLRLYSALEASYNEFVDSAESIAVSEKYLEASAEQSRIVTQKYVNGLVTYQDWSTIENDYINTQRSLLAAKRDAVLAEAAWDNMLGR